MRILVVGGAGAMARVTIRDLLADAEVEAVIAADRDGPALAQLRSVVDDHRLVVEQIDVRDEAGLVVLMKRADVTVNATWYRFNLVVMGAAIKARVPLIDLGGLYHMTRRQLAMDPQVREAGILVIPGMGSDPGTSNVLCRWAAGRLDRVREIHIRYGSTAGGQTFGFAASTVLDEASRPAVVVRHGQVVEAPPLSDPEEVRFDPRLGHLTTYTILHSELATVPRSIPGLQEMTYKDSWDAAAIARVRALVELGLASEEPVATPWGMVAPRDVLLGMLRHTLREEEPSPGWDELLVRAVGTRDGVETEVRVEVVSAGDLEGNVTGLAYLTGVPPAIVARMVARGEVKGAGVLPPEVCVPPEPYLRELSRRRVEIFETVRARRRIP
ncbi:MAG: saccharopine dehydrogenase C-terminal domain-containing protein [Bacillota bacterium]|nr:saccharopine dehydrogenase C-terminal domain-containing protein [Bacillota bacterium]